MGIEEGSNITVTIDPGQSADMTLDIIVSISIDAVPVFSNKCAVITI